MHSAPSVAHNLKEVAEPNATFYYVMEKQKLFKNNIFYTAKWRNSRRFVLLTERRNEKQLT